VTFTHDHERLERLGMPEAILCEGKDDASLAFIVDELAGQPDHRVLFTRLTSAQFQTLPADLQARLDYDEPSRTAIINGPLPHRTARVAVLTAGTCDLPVARECVRTLEFSGITPTLYADIGVAGLWRLTDRLEEIRSFPVVIVVAGMDAALASVIAGLVGSLVIGVPTSVGYGVASGGQTALNAMLASCGQGIVVTNIDNGFGGACAAIRMLNSTAASGHE
jgi:NCAIR mutase (PurE)-related protein